MLHTVSKMREVSDRLLAPETDVFVDALDSASLLVKGHMIVEVPGVDCQVSLVLELLRPPNPRGLADLIIAPCKHKCAIFKQRRHILQAHTVLSALDPVRIVLRRASASQCGMNSAGCSASTVEAMVSLERPGFGNGNEAGEGALLCVATLHGYGLPFHDARLETSVLP